MLALFELFKSEEFNAPTIESEPLMVYATSESSQTRNPIRRWLY